MTTRLTEGAATYGWTEDQYADVIHEYQRIREDNPFMPGARAFELAQTRLGIEPLTEMYDPTCDC